jgi:hypothetical protein
MQLAAHWCKAGLHALYYLITIYFYLDESSLIKFFYHHGGVF